MIKLPLLAVVSLLLMPLQVQAQEEDAEESSVPGDAPAPPPASAVRRAGKPAFNAQTKPQQKSVPSIPQQEDAGQASPEDSGAAPAMPPEGRALGGAGLGTFGNFGQTKSGNGSPGGKSGDQSAASNDAGQT